MSNVPIQSLIDHIKTAIDVDPWAKEMAEELLKEQSKLVHCKDCKHSCDYSAMYDVRPYRCEKHSGFREADWFCADGERQGDNE